MKKIAIILAAAAAFAACTKSEVNYDRPQEIGFAPATKNITKATGRPEGPLETSQELGVWAYWDNDAEVDGNGVINTPAYAGYTDEYLNNALFAYKSTADAWGGTGNGYPWPVNGALVFAGYTTPGDDVLGNTAVDYNLTDDEMTFTNYTNTEFDLCWFGRTSSAYNYRAAGTAVDVTLHHALSWITVAVYGVGTPVDNWTITSITLENVATAGTATCDGASKKATWEGSAFSTEAAPLTIFSGSHTITAGTAEGSTTTGETLSNNILIPSETVELKVNYTFPVNGVDKTDSKTITLNAGQVWESGIHYTYTLVFKGNEILVAPSYGEWGEDDQTVTVE